MKFRRNDPCPCGSGRKYKRCCLKLERGAGGPVNEGAALRAAAMATSWLMDVVPTPLALSDDPGACPGVLLIVADGLVLHSEILRRPSAEADELADEMARQFELVVERFEVRPGRVVVRDAELARFLGDRLTAVTGVAVEEGSLDDLHVAADSLREFLGGSGEGRPFGSATRTWKGWGLPEAQCTELFHAAARFFRAAPWRYLWDAEYLEVTGPSGRRWFAAVMGRGGYEYGLALHADRADLESLFAAGAAGRPDLFKEPVLSLLFEDGSTISRELRKEISRAGWEVAGPAAYPMLMAINTRAGGITRQQATDLAANLWAVAAFTGAYGTDLDAGRPVPDFVDKESGAKIHSERHMDPDKGQSGGRQLEPGAAEGPGACPEAALETEAIIAERRDSERSLLRE